LGRPMWPKDTGTFAQNILEDIRGELAPTGQEVDPYEHYADAALADCCGFFQITKTLFVVQGWDAKRQRSTVSRHHFQGYVNSSLDYFQTAWHHLQRVRIGDDICVACFCPQSSQCFHERFLREYQDEKFPEDIEYDEGGRFSKLII